MTCRKLWARFVSVGIAGTVLSLSAQSRRVAGAGVRGGASHQVLLLGQDQRHHNSHARRAGAPLASRGIQMTHVSTPAEALVLEKLANYDALMRANHTKITPNRRRRCSTTSPAAKGWSRSTARRSCSRIPRRSSRWSAAEFRRHGMEVHRRIVQAEHPIMKGFQNFTTPWDETYVHWPQPSPTGPF